MTELRAVAADDWKVLRDIRLDALRDAPYAFAATFDQATAIPGLTWREYTRDSILAYRPEFDDQPQGLVASVQRSPGELGLISMWVRPQARGRDVGTALVEAIVERARRGGQVHVHL